MSIRNRTVGDLVTEDFRRGGVFKKFGIDFCCGGGQTLEQACERRNVDVEDVERALLTPPASSGFGGNVQPDAWPLPFLADYIVTMHHTYVRENLPVLLQFSRKVAHVHGHNNPALIQVAQHVEELAFEMSEHMLKEEEVLFPYVHELSNARENGRDAAAPGFGTVSEPISVMEDDHERAGALMLRIRELTNDYRPPEGACNTYRALYAKLEEFEEDLHRHVHLENNILFPKAATLEASLRTQAAA